MPQTPTIQTSKIINHFYQALTNRELDALAHLFAEETDWEIAGNEELAPC